MSTESSVVDLRQYTLRPGQRDTLIALFDRYFVDGQEEVGIHVIGQFRDLDNPELFVWLREFESMAARGDALPRFYGGPVWRAHREQANATMIDSDNALLLEPIYRGPTPGQVREPQPARPADSLVTIMIAYLSSPVTATDRDLSRTIRTELTTAGANVEATLATHAAENNFPVLPLRDEHVLVWISTFPSDQAYDDHQARLANAAGWSAAMARLATRTSATPIQHLRLRPTDRSQLR
jgi:quinol monooxygenase YgiN